MASAAQGEVREEIPCKPHIFSLPSSELGHPLESPAFGTSHTAIIPQTTALGKLIHPSCPIAPMRLWPGGDLAETKVCRPGEG